MLPEKLAFVDIETTGASLATDRIIEIGIVRVENNRVVKTFQTLLNPQTYLPSFIEQLTGITEDAISSSPTFSLVKDEILDTLSDCIFVAHNVRFDYGFLRHEFKRHSISFSQKHFCTVKLSQYLFPRYKHHNLDSIIKRFNILCENRHRAFADASVLWEFYQKAQGLVDAKKFTAAVSKALRRPSLPLHITHAVLDSLPEAPGVYIFYGDNGTPLYVGKSVNMRERILSHFANDHSSSQEMRIAQQVQHIETLVTAGELGALFLESKLIKTLQPLHNRTLRQSRLLVLVKMNVDSHGYQHAFIEEATEIRPEDTDGIVGVFKSQQSAKTFLRTLAESHKLCQKLLSLEKIKGACFSYRLGRCFGACVGKEEPIRYNLRFLEAIQKQKIKTWPFQGPICVTEKSEDSNREETFLIDKWCLLASAKFDEWESIDRNDHEYRFDVDTYKILLRYLNAAHKKRYIRVVSEQFQNSHSQQFSS